MKLSIPPFPRLLPLFLISVLLFQQAKGDEQVSQTTPAITEEAPQEDLSSIEAAPVQDNTVWNSLSQKEKHDLMHGQCISKEEPSQDRETFTFIIYRLIRVSPVQAISIFWDTDMTKEILPNFENMEIEKNQLNSIVASYTVAVPGVPWPYNTDTVKNTITLDKFSDNDYRVSYLGAGVKGKSVVAKVEENLEAIAHQQKTLLCYRSSTVLDKNSYFIRMLPLEKQREGAKGVALHTMHNFVTVLQQTTDFENHIRKVMDALGEAE